MIFSPVRGSKLKQEKSLNTFEIQLRFPDDFKNGLDEETGNLFLYYRGAFEKSSSKSELVYKKKNNLLNCSA